MHHVTLGRNGLLLIGLALALAPLASAISIDARRGIDIEKHGWWGGDVDVFGDVDIDWDDKFDWDLERDWHRHGDRHGAWLDDRHHDFDEDDLLALLALRGLLGANVDGVCSSKERELASALEDILDQDVDCHDAAAITSALLGILREAGAEV